MFYTIYKITNLVNGKIYIGKHQTKNLDDCYMGSGKLITRAIQKHGLENFEKEILFVFETEYQMNDKEAELVTEEFVKEDTNYNLCPGGHGGFGYLNDSSEKHKKRALKGAKQGGIATRERNRKKHGINSSRSRPDVIEKSRKTRIENNGGIGFQVGNSSKKAMESFREKYNVDNPSQHPEIKERTKETFKKNKHSQGEKNSQFGTMWITDGYNNKKIKKDIVNIPEGWYKGRSLKIK